MKNLSPYLYILGIKKVFEPQGMVLLCLGYKNPGRTPIQKLQIPEVPLKEEFPAANKANWVHLEVGASGEPLLFIPNPITPIHKV